MFRTLVTSQERRVTELSEAHKSAAQSQANAHGTAISELSDAVDRLSGEIHSMWGALDRLNRIQAIRLSSSINIAPELKDDAAEVLKNIEREKKKRLPE
jgi:hypothetical protein